MEHSIICNIKFSFGIGGILTMCLKKGNNSCNCKLVDHLFTNWRIVNTQVSQLGATTKASKRE